MSGRALAESLRSTLATRRVFALDAARVVPLRDPPAFHRAACRVVRSARRRVALASLYLGDGDGAEAELVRALDAALARARRAERDHAEAQPEDERGHRALPPSARPQQRSVHPLTRLSDDVLQRSYASLCSLRGGNLRPG